MDRQRGLGSTSSQPRLQGLGAGLGAGSVSSRQPSQLKSGLSTLTGANLRPGSLGSGNRLGSATLDSLSAALPLRSVPRPSPEPTSAPAAGATAANVVGPCDGGTAPAPLAADAHGRTAANNHPSVCTIGGLNSSSRGVISNGCRASALTPELNASAPALTPPTTTDAKEEQEPGASRRLGVLVNDRSGAGSGALTAGHSQPYPRRRESAPAAGLFGRSGPPTNGGRPGSGGAAVSLPLRSITFSGGGSTPGASSSGVPHGRKHHPQPQVKIQWLPPEPAKPEPEPAAVPKPAKKKARAAKHVQWELPEREVQKGEQEQHQALEQPDAADVARLVEPPTKRPRLESFAAMAVGPAAAGTPAAPRQRLGGLSQPMLSGVAAASPPLQTLSQKTTAGLYIGGPQTHGSEQEPGSRAGRLREERRTVADGARRDERGAVPARGAVPLLTTLTAKHWAQLQRSLEAGPGSNPVQVATALRALVFYSATAPLPPPAPPSSCSPRPPSQQQPQHRNQEQQQQLERQQQPAPRRERSQDQCPGAQSPGPASGATGRAGPGLESTDMGGHRSDPAPARLPASGQGPEPASAGVGGPASEQRDGQYDSGPDAGSLRVVTADGRPVGLDVCHRRTHVTTDRAAAASVGGQGTEVMGPVSAGSDAAEPQAVAAAEPQAGAITYSDLRAALVAHPGIICALWRLVAAGLGACAAAGEAQDEGGGGDCHDVDSDAAQRQQQQQQRRQTTPVPAAEGGTAAAVGPAGRAASGLQNSEDSDVLGTGSRCATEANGGGPGPALQQEEQEQHREAAVVYPKISARDNQSRPAAAAAEAEETAAAPDHGVGPRVRRSLPPPAVRGAWAGCAAAVLRNLAVTEMVPEQLLSGAGLETCAAVMQEAVLPGRGLHAEDIAASLMELLTALPHQLLLPEPPCAGGEAAAAGPVVAVASAVEPVTQPSGVSGAGAKTAAAAVEAALAAAATVCFGSAGAGAVQRPEREAGRCGGAGGGGGGSSGEQPGLQAAQLRPTDGAEGPQAVPGVSPSRTLLEGVVRVLVDGPEGPLRLRALAAGLLAAWLGVPAHQPAVLAALSSARPQPPRPLAASEAGPQQEAAAPAAAVTWTLGTAAAQPALPSHSSAAAAAATGRPAPLDALAELLCLDRESAKAAAGREAAALAADAAAAGPCGGRPVAPTKDFLKLLAAWRRSDAVASAVEVLHALACGCGPMGRRLLAAHPDLLGGLAVLAAAAAEHSQRAARAAPPSGGSAVAAPAPPPLGSTQGDAVSARSRATLVAAAEVAGDILEVLRADGVTW